MLRIPLEHQTGFAGCSALVWRAVLDGVGANPRQPHWHCNASIAHLFSGTQEPPRKRRVSLLAMLYSPRRELTALGNRPTVGLQASGGAFVCVLPVPDQQLL